MHLDARSTLWLGVGGLDRLETELTPREKPVFRHFVNQPDDPRSIPAANVEAIQSDHLGQLWVGLRAGGLSCYNPATGHFTNYIPEEDNPNSLSHETETGYWMPVFEWRMVECVIRPKIFLPI